MVESFLAKKEKTFDFSKVFILANPTEVDTIREK